MKGGGRRGQRKSREIMSKREKLASPKVNCTPTAIEIYIFSGLIYRLGVRS